jgi:hypothetical protein
VKYYIYISDDKIDMLFPQVPTSVVEKVAAEYELNLKVFKLTRKTEESPGKNRVHRLQAVASYLDESGDVGTVDRPKPYFRGTLPMRMVPFEYRGSELGTGLVTFWGDTPNTALLLGDSQKHLIGAVGDQRPEIGYSHILFWIVEEIENRAGLLAEEQKSCYLDTIPHLRHGLRFFSRFEPPRLEFLAKRVASKTVKSENITQVVLATPIYVAMAD